ncbi:MAG: hypothetical protein EOO24_22010 [Comamonadaceae bacterium]|nr:MAG: hypothetical protein EOO24_22010 [Comamonadaceae bacterium]
MDPTVDLLLVRCRLAEAAGLAERFRAWCERSGLGLQPGRVAWGRDSGWAYAYAGLPSRRLGPAGVQSLRALWQDLVPAAQDVDVSRLQLAYEAPAAAAGQAPANHYVVETDPEDGWREDIVRWYAEEHMPGLASVPGCVLARRYVNLDGGPWSHAHYDLVQAGVLGCEEWLAVRHTAWSSRVRPHFTNTRRTMMDVVA